MGIEGVTKRY